MDAHEAQNDFGGHETSPCSPFGQVSKNKIDALYLKKANLIKDAGLHQVIGKIDQI